MQIRCQKMYSLPDSSFKTFDIYINDDEFVILLTCTEYDFCKIGSSLNQEIQKEMRRLFYLYATIFY